MDWFEPIGAFCERDGAAFWAEPVNALSNAAFLVAAVAAHRRARAADDRAGVALALLTAVVGIGSFLFHTLAVRWAMLADVVPIAVFIHAYFYLAMVRFLRFGPVAAWAATLAFAGFGFGLVPALDAVAGRWLRDIETRLAGIADAPDPADDKIERLLTALAALQRDALQDEPNLFAVHLDATVAARPIARRHRVRLRSLVERVIEEGMATGTFSARDRERAIAYIFDASYRFTHPLAIQHDAEVPRDLVDARFGAVIHAIQRVLRAGIL
ncbi:ceramidase domain-containing protein [Methylobacterium sp. WL103]|uniref:ceramidase domain-containing protein n=1 Tax=Methylobacterium sp. WL103 TaxID=2603891 RepID=UPI001AEDEB23|nr:ceramidase domain-containing protein [Methylobacterium sp. WL103]